MLEPLSDGLHGSNGAGSRGAWPSWSRLASAASASSCAPAFRGAAHALQTSPPELTRVQRAHVHAVEEHCAAVDVVPPLEQRDQRALAASRRADQNYELPRFNKDRQILDCYAITIIFLPYALESHFCHTQSPLHSSRDHAVDEISLECDE